MEHERKTCCDQVSGLIIEYIDGELDGDTAELAARHIAECADCRKLYRDMTAVCRAVAESAYEAPAELHGRVMAAVRAGRVRRRIKRITMYAGVGVAAMLCVTLGVRAMLGRLGNGADKASGTNEKYYLMDDCADYSYKSEVLIFNNSGSELNDIYRASVAAENAMKSQAQGDNALCKGESETDSEINDLPETTCAACSTGAPATPAECGSLCLAGEWNLTEADGSQVVLRFLNTTDFYLTDAKGSVTAGRYEVSGGMVSFIYDGGRADYDFTVSGSALELSHLRGDRLIR